MGSEVYLCVKESFMPLYLSRKESASLLGVSSATLINWEKQGLIQAVELKNKNAYPEKLIINLKNRLENGEIPRLENRANKKHSRKTFIPQEYLPAPEHYEQIKKLVEFIRDNNLQFENSLFILAVKWLSEQKFIKQNVPLKRILSSLHLYCKKENLKAELLLWQQNAEIFEPIRAYDELFEFNIPYQYDILGLIYQALLYEGSKSKAGAYYTPEEVCRNIVQDYEEVLRGNSKILDPCCGTGQFLIAASRKMKEVARTIRPQNLWGYDIDPLAVRIARLNLMVEFPGFDFNPNIYQRNVIYHFNYDNRSHKFNNFDLIIGNPPWGAEFTIQQTSFLKEKYPEILSFESFSYFLFIALQVLNQGKYLSFILPESILNIKTHADIRRYILTNASILKIESLGRLFRKVFTPVIRMDLLKEEPKSHQVNIKHQIHFQIPQSRFTYNKNYIFDIYNTPEDELILKKIYSIPHTTLQGQADWGLGIVTGNNKKFIKNAPGKGYREVIKGSDVFHFYIRRIQQFILYQPEQFQQMATLNRYHAPEKLVYKFISTRLVFAVDNKKRLTLNSANILIPRIKSYPIYALMAFFNSHLFQFVFKKKFFTHKVLRNHLEQLPIPLYSAFPEQIRTLENLAQRISIAYVDKNIYQELFDKINQTVYDVFGLTRDEIIHLEKNI